MKKLMSFILLSLLPYMVAVAEQVTYLHHDPLGSVIATSNSTGQVEKTTYLSYGLSTTNKTGDPKPGYTGKSHFKGMGLTYFGSRWYDPEVGRFISIDPVAWPESRPVHSFNRYAYANNNPNKYVDPDGEFPFCSFCGINPISRLDFSLDSAPVVGNLKSAYEAGSGKGLLTGQDLSNFSRGAAVAGIAFPWLKHTKHAGKFDVGSYNQIKGGASGLDAHHAGQKAVMKKLVDGYDPNTAPAILVPKVGHTIKGPNGIVSRSTKDFDSARDLLARDVKELRRVYSDIPNSQLKNLINLNKEMYPSAFMK